VQNSKQRNSIGSTAQVLGSRVSSDADFLQILQQQQQQQQQPGQALEAVFHSQNPPATPAAGADKGAAAAAGAGARGARSPHPGTVINVTNGPNFLSPSPGPWFGPASDTPMPPAPVTTPVSLPLPPPGSTPAAAAAGGGGVQVQGAALAAAAAAASGVNPLLTNLPSSTKWGSGKGGASSLQRRLSGGAESIPHRLTSIAEVSVSSHCNIYNAIQYFLRIETSLRHKPSEPFPAHEDHRTCTQFFPSLIGRSQTPAHVLQFRLLF
jgi:hypothetical protein